MEGGGGGVNVSRQNADMRDENDLLMAPDVKCYFAIHFTSLNDSFKFLAIKKIEIEKEKNLKKHLFYLIMLLLFYLAMLDYQQNIVYIF